MGYSKGYLYPHNHENAVVYQSYLPDEIRGRKYYFPTERGFEKELKIRLEKIEELKEKLRKIRDRVAVFNMHCNHASYKYIFYFIQ